MLFLLVLLAVVAGLRLWVIPHRSSEKNPVVAARSLYPEVSRLIREHYVDPVDPRNAWHGAYGALLRNLDSCSSYIPVALLQRSRAWREGRGYWAGVWVRPGDQGFTVSRILPRSPAKLSKLRVGDILIRIDDQEITARTWAEVRLLLYADKEYTFRLIVRRAGSRDPLNILLPAIALPADLNLRDLPGSVTHLDLRRLTPAAVAAVSAAFQSRPGRGWIIDLRNYLHGDLDPCLSLADMMVPPVSMLALHTRHGNQRIRAGSIRAEQTRMVALVGPETIMYADILARMLRDAGASLVGESGGGINAHLRRIPLPDGAELELVDGWFYWGGRNLRNESLHPDVREPGDEAALARAQSMLKRE